MERVNAKATASRTAVCELENGRTMGSGLERERLFRTRATRAQAPSAQQPVLARLSVKKQCSRRNILNMRDQGSGPPASAEPSSLLTPGKEGRFPRVPTVCNSGLGTWPLRSCVKSEGMQARRAESGHRDVCPSLPQGPRPLWGKVLRAPLAEH